MKKFGVLFSLFLLSCGGEELSVDCTNTSIELALVEKASATCGEANGRFQVVAEGGVPPYSFFLAGSNLNSDGFFDAVSAGEKTLTVSDANNCSASLQFSIEEVQLVSFSNQILPIIEANCSLEGCHVAANPLEKTLPILKASRVTHRKFKFGRKTVKCRKKALSHKGKSISFLAGLKTEQILTANFGLQ